MATYVCPICGTKVIAQPGSILEFEQNDEEDWVCINPEDAEDEDFLIPNDQEELNQFIEEGETHCYCPSDRCGEPMTEDGKLLPKHLWSISPDEAYAWAVYTNQGKDGTKIKLRNGEVIDLVYDDTWKELPEEYYFTKEDLLPEAQLAVELWVDTLDFDTWSGDISECEQI